MHYQTKIERVEAMRWLGNPLSTRTILDWAGPAMKEGVNKLMILTAEGDMFVSIGDWVLRDPKGTFWRLSDAHFKAKYEPSPPTLGRLLASAVVDES